MDFFRRQITGLPVLTLFLTVVSGFLSPIASARAEPAIENVLVITAAQSIADRNFKKIAHFYGLSARKIDAGNKAIELAMKEYAPGHFPLAIGISLSTWQESLSIEQQALLREAVNEGANLLIYDFYAVDKSASLPALGLPGRLHTGRAREIKAHKISQKFPQFTREFTGAKIRYYGRLPEESLLDHRSHKEINPIIQANGRAQSTTILATFALGKGKVFLLTPKQVVDFSKKRLIDFYKPEYFSQTVPLMMFLRYAGGERAWHRQQDFANFTIDDPWLIEPFGNLTYGSLLKEMKKHGFHTTIAFVPWNYRRSRRKAVDIFQNNRRFYSLAIHGNDHDLGELSALATTMAIANDLQQALVRMDELKNLTSLNYDKVMIFPRKLGSAQSFGILREMKFLATVNARDLPFGTKAPRQFDYNMRPAMLEFSGFPAMQRRYVFPPRDVAPILFDLFIDKPALFYGHQQDFADGIDAFSAVADQINNLAVRPEWRSLGDITKRLYLERINESDVNEVKMFSNDIVLKNKTDKTKRYLINKAIHSETAIEKVLVNDKIVPVSRKKNLLKLAVKIPPGDAKEIVITFESNLRDAGAKAKDPAYQTARSSYILRFLSDFRDIYLSRSAAGRLVIKVQSLVDFKEAFLIIAAVILAMLSFIGLRRKLVK